MMRLTSASPIFRLVRSVRPHLDPPLGAARPQPLAAPLDFALPLTFIAMVVPILKSRPMIAASVSAGLVAPLALSLPFKLGIILAALTGIVVGTVLENEKPSRGTL